MLSEDLKLPRTDPFKWRLECSPLGATKWVYEESPSTPQSFYVKHSLSPESTEQQSDASKAKNDTEALLKGATFFSRLQDPSGIFPMQYKGPMFMTIGYVGVFHCAGIPIPEPVRIELIRYLVNTAHPVDGGWGLYETDKSTCFGTTLGYVILRLLGLLADHPVCIRARKTLKSLGGALKNPHWGKAWLAILNLYDWDGVNPIPPELVLTPYSLNPAHPFRLWVHTRAVFLPLSYLSVSRFSAEESEITRQLRSEIFNQNFGSINWDAHRNDVCGVDLYYPHSSILDTANYAISLYGHYLRPNWIKNKALDKVYEHIKKELENTDGLCIAPVSYGLNACVVLQREGKDSDLFKQFISGFDDVLFLGPQGMTVMGTNGGQVWDVSFVVQYFFVAGLADRPEYEELIIRGVEFLLRSQFDTDCVRGLFRDARKGAFPYSTKAQGYTVSDCTAEGIKAILMAKNHPKYKDRIEGLVNDELLYSGIDVLLGLQNLGSFHYGSFSTYEKIRSTPYLELANPAEVFGNIMVEYPYVECTDLAVLGLTYFTKYYDYRKKDIEFAVDAAIKYIEHAQNPDGSWYGCWGVCFTYAGMFALEAFHSVGKNYGNCDVVKRGCDFLVLRQRQDGGWSESMKSCETHTYVEGKRSFVVQTAWAVIGLMLAEYPDKDIVRKGIDFLVREQRPSGEWISEGVEGVFNHSCGIEYPNYRFAFPIKALGLYQSYR